MIHPLDARRGDRQTHAAPRGRRAIQLALAIATLGACGCGGPDEITCDSVLYAYSGITMDRTLDLAFA